jgi:hypothetical protein
VDLIGLTDYKVDVGGKVKTYHANLLKGYLERQQGEEGTVAASGVEPWYASSGLIESPGGSQSGLMTKVCAAVIEQEPDVGAVDNEGLLDLPPTHATESVADVKIGTNLTAKQKAELDLLLAEFADVLTDVPGQTNLAEHSIMLTSEEPIRSKPYPTPHAMRDTVRNEVTKMLDMGIIERSDSPYASPIVLVKTADGQTGFV